MAQKIFQNTAFVLVRPEFLGNIGSVARVMKNFGFYDLRLVAPPKNYKDSDARIMAVGAFDVLKKAAVFATLEEALADRQLSIASSSGRRRSRQLNNLGEVIDECSSYAAVNGIAFVLGNERNGLLDSELSLCNKKVRIESSPEFPALNLAQAAGIIAYSLSSRAGAHKKQPSQKQRVNELPSFSELHELFYQ